MNCREVEHHLFAEQDGTLDANQRAALDEHVVGCPSCRRTRDTLAAAIHDWKRSAAKTRVPDIEREWHEVRRAIRGAEAESHRATSVSRSRTFAWFAVPLATAAAVAIALFVNPTSPRTLGSGSTVAEIARADSVEVPGENTSAMVFVDDKSGWLIVLADDPSVRGI